jgi:hypothetical protein
MFAFKPFSGDGIQLLNSQSVDCDRQSWLF